MKQAARVPIPSTNVVPGRREPPLRPPACHSSLGRSKMALRNRKLGESNVSSPFSGLLDILGSGKARFRAPHFEQTLAILSPSGWYTLSYSEVGLSQQSPGRASQSQPHRLRVLHSAGEMPWAVDLFRILPKILFQYQDAHGCSSQGLFFDSSHYWVPLGFQETCNVSCDQAGGQAGWWIKACPLCFRIVEVHGFRP